MSAELFVNSASGEEVSVVGDGAGDGNDAGGDVSVLGLVTISMYTSGTFLRRGCSSCSSNWNAIKSVVEGYATRDYGNGKEIFIILAII